MASTSAKGRKGKIGKKKHWIAAYYMSGKPFFNKARRLLKHITRYGSTDAPANEAFRVAVANMPRSMSKAFDDIYR